MYLGTCQITIVILLSKVWYCSIHTWYFKDQVKPSTRIIYWTVHFLLSVTMLTVAMLLILSLGLSTCGRLFSTAGKNQLTRYRDMVLLPFIYYSLSLVISSRSSSIWHRNDSPKLQVLLREPILQWNSHGTPTLQSSLIEKMSLEGKMPRRERKLTIMYGKIWLTYIMKCLGLGEKWLWKNFDMWYPYIC